MHHQNGAQGSTAEGGKGQPAHFSGGDGRAWLAEQGRAQAQRKEPVDAGGHHAQPMPIHAHPFAVIALQAGLHALADRPDEV